jgi:hypothetical protein
VFRFAVVCSVFWVEFQLYGGTAAAAAAAAIALKFHKS